MSGLIEPLLVMTDFAHSLSPFVVFNPPVPVKGLWWGLRLYHKNQCGFYDAFNIMSKDHEFLLRFPHGEEHDFCAVCEKVMPRFVVLSSVKCEIYLRENLYKCEMVFENNCEWKGCNFCEIRVVDNVIISTQNMYIINSMLGENIFFDAKGVPIPVKKSGLMEIKRM